MHQKSNATCQLFCQVTNSVNLTAESFRRCPTHKSGEYTEYTWDRRNRLVAVDTWTDSGKGTKEKGVRYTYDAFDRRIAKEIDEDANGVFTDSVDWAEHFVYDGEHIALVFDEAGSLKNRYLHGPAIDQVLAEETVGSMDLSDEVYWQLADNLGSIRDVVTYDGIDTATVVKHLTYGAFGNITSDSNMSLEVRFAYTGREFDIETGLYYYRARYYDADNGRFVSEDPIVFLAGDTSLVRYVFNSPINLTDPSGEVVPFIAAGALALYFTLAWETPAWAPTVDDTDYGMSQMAYEMRQRNLDLLNPYNCMGLKGGRLGGSGPGMGGRPSGIPKPVTAASGVSKVWPRHHPFPKYLGGATDQTLKKIPRKLHERFHAALDKFKESKYARAKGASHFKNIDRDEVIRDLTEFYNTAEGGIFKKYLPDFLQAVRESTPCN